METTSSPNYTCPCNTKFSVTGTINHNLDDKQKKLIDMILQNEGGYAWLKGDSGGETYRGIARRYHKDWEGWGVVDRIKRERGVSKLPNNMDIPEINHLVYDFYYNTYYVPMAIDSYEDITMAALVFHRGIGMGSSNMGKLVVRAINRVTKKGLNEPESRKKPTTEEFAIINGDMKSQITEAFVMVAKERYKEIDDKKKAKNPNYPGYYNGWCNSIQKDIDYVKKNFKA